MITEDKYQLLRLYIRGLSVESPLTGRLPRQINQPNIDIDIDPKITRVADNLYEVAARFTVSARANGVQLYLVELTQAGFFSISPSAEAHKEALLRRVFPQLLYPAARSSIVGFIVAAGYQPLVLDHIRMESLFTTTPVTDKRQLPPEPVPLVQTEPVVQVQHPESITPWKKNGLRAAVLAGAALTGLLLALQVHWQRHPAVFPGEHRDTTADKQTPIVSGIVADSPVVTGNLSSAVENELSGLPVRQVEQMGSTWLAAQDTGFFTVELLRTDDLKKAENLIPPEEGQPLFLVKLGSTGTTEYAVLSGAYGNEGQARQVAAKSAGYRAIRFGDIKANLRVER